jgi:hypothetical protein
MNDKAWFPNRENKVPTIFFVIWGSVCVAALVAGPWMLVSAVRYRQTHREAEATVEVENRKSGRVAHLLYAVDGKPHEITVAEPSHPKERKGFQETYQNGRTASVWYPIGEPTAAEPEGDNGRLVGGIIFTGVGAFFSMVGAMAFVAEFYPNRYVRFG